MNVSERIINVLDALCKKFGIVIDWTSNNVLPYIEQLCGKFIKFEIVMSIMWIIVGLIIGIIGFICWKAVYNHKEFGVTHYVYINDDHFGRSLSYIGIALIFIISSTIILKQTYDIISCLTFPEKIIYDYIINEIRLMN